MPFANHFIKYYKHYYNQFKLCSFFLEKKVSILNHLLKYKISFLLKYFLAFIKYPFDYFYINHQ
jgi:hypothetical protein